MRSTFDAAVRRPKVPADADWTFVRLPPEVSATMPRRGRTSVVGTIDGHRFSAWLEPDGRKGHWLRIDPALLAAAGVAVGSEAAFELEPAANELEPTVPTDLADALARDPAASATWAATTTIARIDWVHWIESAKQPKTRAKRVADACEMLAGGKDRVCCFDNSGYFSKAFKPPEPRD